MEPGFFTEKDGTPSNGRLNSSLMIYVGIGVLLLTVIAPFLGITVEAGQNMTIGFGLIGTGSGVKVIQKFGEK